MTNKRKILAAAFAATTATLVPGVAQAQLIGPCPSIIMPPPCIVFDYKKLADVATQNANEIKKIQETVNTVQQARATAQGLASDVKALTSFDINGTTRITSANLSPILGGYSESINGIADRVGDKLFSGEDGSDANQEAIQARAAVAADANADAYAYAQTANNDAMVADKRYCKLAKKVQKSPDLRTDWAINSEVKLELINARARHSYLLTEFVKLQSANNVAPGKYGSQIRTALPRIGLAASAIAIKAIASSPKTDQSDKVRELQDLYSRAQSIMGSLGVVQMTGSLQSTLQGVIDDYNNTVARKAQIMTRFQTEAQSWRNNSKRGSAANTINVVLTNLASIDSQMTALRSQPIESLAGAFKARNIDVNAMLQADVDPRQFIGTWADPVKYETTRNMANTLQSGVLNSSLEGDEDNREFVQVVADYNDVRLEEAWKKVYADEARVKLGEIAQTIGEENTKQGTTVNEAAVTAELQTIVARANALGQEISAGRDEGSKARAAQILTSLQTLVSGGTTLPPVEVALVP